MALEKLRTPSLSGSETEEAEETEAEQEVEQESSGSRLGTLTKVLGVGLAAVIGVVTLRKLRARGSDAE